MKRKIQAIAAAADAVFIILVIQCSTSQGKNLIII